MKDLEILNRGSGFLIPSISKNFQKRFHLVTSSHVVSPWRWPKFYHQDWIQALNETHTHYTIELRHDDGVFITQVELDPAVFHHPTRDLAILHVKDEAYDVKLLNTLGYQMPGLDVNFDRGKEQVLAFHGHNVVGDIAPDGSDLRMPIPFMTKGNVVFESKEQIFARTDNVLVEGTCGGPVVYSRSSNNDRESLLQKAPLVVGCIEGIVPPDHEKKEVQGLAVFIEAKDIHGFISDVEDGLIECVQGGQAAEFIGNDQDPKKMTLEHAVGETGEFEIYNSESGDPRPDRGTRR